MPAKNIIFILTILKTPIAIFVLLVFFLAQFGKVINYCFCTIAAYQQTSNLACDCEKQLFTDLKKETQDKHQSPLTYSSQPATEELFHFTENSNLVFQYAMQIYTWPPCTSDALQHIFGNPVFHPPLQAV
jgi:hypothetical protein